MQVWCHNQLIHAVLHTYQIDADLLESDMSEVVNCHLCIAVVAVGNSHPVRLVSLETIMALPTTLRKCIITITVVQQACRVILSINIQVKKMLFLLGI